MKLVKWFLLAAALLLVSGCAQRERIMLPPAVDLGDTQRLTVVYWENYTLDPGLSLELERSLVQHLDQYYHVADPYDVESTLYRLGVRRGMPMTRDLAVEIGSVLDADLIVAGEVQYFFEDVRQSAPQREEPFPPGTGYQWYVNHTTSTSVVIRGRVIQVDDGEVVFTEEVEGRKVLTVKDSLQWNEPTPPPSTLIPQPDRSQLPQARLGAIEDAARRFTSQLLPRYEWRRIP